MAMRKQPGQVPKEAGGASQLKSASEGPTTAGLYSSWQKEAAAFLLRYGFRPGEATGHVQHVTNPQRPGRTFGSVWQAMRNLERDEPRPSGGQAQDQDHARPDK